MEYCHEIFSSVASSDFNKKPINIQNVANRMELVDLLQRQEKILSNKTFIANLPDRGDKVKKLVDQIKKQISEIDGKTLKSESSENEQNVEVVMDVETVSPISDMPKIKPERSVKDGELVVIEKGFGDLAIHEGPFYDVVKNAGTKPKKSKFVLNRQDNKPQENHDYHNHMSQNVKNRDTSSTLDEILTTDHKSQFIDNNMETAPRQSSKTTIMISYNECRSLHVQQQATQKQQQAAMMAERLLQKYGLAPAVPVPTTYSHPEGTTKVFEGEDLDWEDDVQQGIDMKEEIHSQDGSNDTEKNMK